MTWEVAQLLSRLRVPQPSALVRAARQHEPSVVREDGVPDRVRMTVKLAHEGATPGIPQPADVVAPGCQDRPAIRREGRALDPAGLRNCPKLRSRRGIPDRAVGPARVACPAEETGTVGRDDSAA